MPWRLLLFVIFLVLATVFIGFNLDNVCNISVGFYTFTDVPVFMALLGALGLGIVIMIPAAVVSRKKAHLKYEKSMKQSKTKKIHASSFPQSSDMGQNGTDI